MRLEDYIRDIADFPQEGILFRDITPLLKDAAAFDNAISRMAEFCDRVRPDAIASIESRGFLFAAPLAQRIAKPLVPIRKAGKLPLHHPHRFPTRSNTAPTPSRCTPTPSGSGQRVVIVDDLLATGGTLVAAGQLVEAAGASVAGVAVLIELTELGGRAKLSDYEIHSVIEY